MNQENSFSTKFVGMKNGLYLLLLFIISCNIKRAAKGNPEEHMENIRLPEGFKIEVFAEGVENVRSLCLTENGWIIAGTKGKGNVYVIRDTDKDHKADEIFTLFSDLHLPNGVAFKNGDLYLAEVNKISVVRDIEKNYKNSPKLELINNDFPNENYHGWKFIAFGPDGKLYVPVGAPCNICDFDSSYCNIYRMNDDGTGKEIYAEGVRNTVGFDWHPQTGEMWFTDNGRDWMGDTLPPDELNKITRKGQHFGFPYCHYGELSDPKYGDQYPCDSFVKPEIKLGPHVAALALEFYIGNMFPVKYKDYIFIAEHGSWNSSTPVGYRISMVKLENGKAVSYEVFAEGWLDGKIAFGRPVDILEMPDGSLLVSDDFADKIYRISYNAE